MSPMATTADPPRCTVSWVAALAIGLACGAYDRCDAVTELVDSVCADAGLLPAARRCIPTPPDLDPAVRTRAISLLSEAEQVVRRRPQMP